MVSVLCMCVWSLTIGGVFLCAGTAHAQPTVWDDDLWILGVAWDPAEVPAGDFYWRVVEGYAISPEHGGAGQVELRVLSLSGTIMAGVVAELVEGSTRTYLFSLSGPGWGSASLTSTEWCPPLQPGPAYLKMLGNNPGAEQPADLISGLGLPCGRGWSFRFVFQETIQGIQPQPSVSPTPTIGPPAGQNLVLNPGAEFGDLRYWNASPSIVVDPSVGVPDPVLNRSGIHRFGWVSFQPASATMSQEISVTPGHVYAAGLWSVERGGLSEYMVVSWVDGAFGALQPLYQTTGAQELAPLWYPHQGALVSPTTNRITLEVALYKPAPEGVAVFHLDDFYLVDITTPTPSATATPSPSFTPTITSTSTVPPTPTMTRVSVTGTPTPKLPGGIVGPAYLYEVSCLWHRNYHSAEYHTSLDPTGDGRIDSEDMLEIIRTWGAVLPPTPTMTKTPMPSATPSTTHTPTRSPIPTLTRTPTGTPTGPSPTSTPQPAPWPHLKNGSFDENPNYGVAASWLRWGAHGDSVMRSSNTIVHTSPGLSQAWHMYSGTTVAGGLYQEVTATEGRRFAFGCWGYVNNPNLDTPVACSVGINPVGNPFSMNRVAWSEQVVNPSGWVWMETSVIADFSKVVVYLRVEVSEALPATVYVYFDDAVMFAQ